MPSASKYMNRKFEGFVVEDVFIANHYYKEYKSCNLKHHNYYKAVIFNKSIPLRLTISVSLLKDYLTGKKSIIESLNKKPCCCSNSEIAAYRQLKRIQNGN